MKEEFEKVNDYTLAVNLTMETYDRDYSVGKYQLTRIFNFEAGQVTTLARDWTHQRRGQESGGSSASSLQMSIQNFRDIENNEEIAEMHRKLAGLGGHPPPLEDSLGKKPGGLRPANATPQR